MIDRMRFLPRLVCAIFGHQFEAYVEFWTERYRGRRIPKRRHLAVCARCNKVNRRFLYK